MICIFWQHFFVDTNFIKHNRHFMSTYFLLDRSNSCITFIVFGGIDLCIDHSGMYPKYFLPDFGPSSGEDLLQKWCNFCFSILPLCKNVFTVEDYDVNDVNNLQAGFNKIGFKKIIIVCYQFLILLFYP